MTLTARERTAFREQVTAINELAYLDPHQPFETQVNLWCEAAVAVLSELPKTQSELCLAYKRKRLLAGRPLDHFLFSQQAGKKAEFERFLDGASMGT